MELSKSDWKLYREKMAGWQENYIKKDDRLIIIWMHGNGRED